MEANNTRELLSDLFDEFEQEKNDLKIRYDDNLNRIDIIESTITELKRFTDESNMFSPRQVSNDNSKRIEELIKEKADIEEENKVIENQLKYYSDKSQSISSVFASYKEDPSNEETAADPGPVKEDTRDAAVPVADIQTADQDDFDGVTEEKQNSSFPKEIILADKDDKDRDIKIFTKTEYNDLVSRLEKIITMMDKDPGKCRVELGNILYDLKHKR